MSDPADRLASLVKWAAPVINRLGIDVKSKYEFAYWRWAKRSEGRLGNAHYEGIYTTLVNLDRDFYAGKQVLDVGCGPRGSLEWAEMAAERVGLDPLVPQYEELGIRDHAMSYVAAPAEDMPFADGYFDVVTSINSLDHVDNLDDAVGELVRVLRPGGHLLVVVDIHDRPTVAEPTALEWTLTRRFEPDLEVVEEAHYEHDPERRGALAAVAAGMPFDHDDPTRRYGALHALLRKGS